jgi:uncharacterized protein YcfJ
MKTTILAASVAAAVAAAVGPAQAQTFGDTARVVATTPVYDRVAMPRRDCRLETVSAYEERRTVTEPEYRERREGIGAGTVIGAIVGGVIGHQFGGSTAGRDHGTAAGAVVGGLIGHQAERDNDGYRTAGRDVVVERVPVTREVQRCEEVADATEKIVAYDVRYEYNGRQFTTRMPYDPGPQIPVNVDVRPPASPLPPNYRGTY